MKVKDASCRVRVVLTKHRFQSRAFLLLPMVANIGTVIGPILGGITSDPAANYPNWFGGNSFLEKFPYSTPNLISAFFLGSATLAVFFGLDEVSSFTTIEWCPLT